MARKLDDKVLAYVKVQAIAGTSGRAIHRALTSGQDTELAPVSISERRVQQLAADFKREARDNLEAIDPASLDTAYLNERAILLAEVRRRRKIACRMPDSSTKAIDLLIKVSRFLDTVEHNTTGKAAKDPQRVSAGLTPDKKSTLDLLGETLHGPASPTPQTNTTPTSEIHNGYEAQSEDPDQANESGIEGDGSGQSKSNAGTSIPA